MSFLRSDLLVAVHESSCHRARVNSCFLCILLLPPTCYLPPREPSRIPERQSLLISITGSYWEELLCSGLLIGHQPTNGWAVLGSGAHLLSSPGRSFVLAQPEVQWFWVECFLGGGGCLGVANASVHCSLLSPHDPLRSSLINFDRVNMTDAYCKNFILLK